MPEIDLGKQSTLDSAVSKATNIKNIADNILDVIGRRSSIVNKNGTLTEKINYILTALNFNGYSTVYRHHVESSWTPTNIYGKKVAYIDTFKGSGDVPFVITLDGFACHNSTYAFNGTVGMLDGYILYGNILRLYRGYTDTLSTPLIFGADSYVSGIPVDLMIPFKTLQMSSNYDFYVTYID